MLNVLSRFLLTVVLFTLVLFGSGCERPFVERAGATFEVVEPESLEDVFSQRALPLQVEVSAFRDVQRVEVNGNIMSFSEQHGAWTDTVRLQTGINALRLAAYDAEGVSGRDTLYAARLSYALNAVPDALPVPRGGHTATQLHSGALLVTGGAPEIDAGAAGDAFLLSPNRLSVQQLDAALVAPRTGHTATALPDGRVLLLGGSRSVQPASTDDLVRVVEVYDPDAQAFRRLPVSGANPRRARHVAFLLQSAPNPVVAVYGGQGNIGSDAAPILPRGDLRRFELRGDTLVALDPTRGPILEEGIDGHTLTPIGGGQSLIAGSYFDEAGAHDVTFRLDRDPLRPLPAPSFRTPRTRHAAVPVVNDGVLFFGGMWGAPATALRAIELHAPRAGQTFRVSGHRPPPTFSLSATKHAPGRILLLGGFSADGMGRTYALFFDLTE